MFAWLLILTSIAYILCTTNSTDNRIVGGSSVPASDYPYIAAILYDSGSLSCGGSILKKESPAVILTAAHCISGDMSNRKVRLYASDYNGAYNSVTNKYRDVTISDVIVHEDYTQAYLGDDIALLFITQDISNIGRLGTVTIAPLAYDGDESFATNLEVVGYGDNTEGGYPTPTLEAVTVPYVTRAACIRDLGNYITNEMICAGGDGYDSCQGDSGGPILTVDSNEQVGIVSWGYGCADTPGVYTNIGVYYDWILSHVDLETPHPTTVTSDPTRATHDPTQDPTQSTQNPTRRPTSAPSQQPTTYGSLWDRGDLVRFKARGCGNLCINENDNGLIDLADCDTGSRVQWQLAWSPSHMKFRLKNEDTKLLLTKNGNSLLETNVAGDFFEIEYKVGWMDNYYIKLTHFDSGTCPQWDDCDDNALELVDCSSLSSNPWNEFNIQPLDIDTTTTTAEPTTATHEPTHDPTTVTQEPTSVTHDPTISTHDPTRATHDPTTVTDHPTPATSEPTLVTQNPTHDPTADTQEPTPATHDPTISTHDPTRATQDPTSATHHPTMTTEGPTTGTLNPTHHPSLLTRAPTRATLDPTAVTHAPATNPTMRPTSAPSKQPTSYGSLWNPGDFVRFKARGCSNLCLNEKDNGQIDLADCDTGSRVRWQLQWWSPSHLKFRIRNVDTQWWLRRNSNGLLETIQAKNDGDFFEIEYKVGWMDNYYIKLKHFDSDTCPQWDGCEDNALELVACSSLSSRNQFNIQALDIDASDLKPMPQLFIVGNYYNLTWLMIAFMVIVFGAWTCVLMKTEHCGESKWKENEPSKMLSESDETDGLMDDL